MEIFKGCEGRTFVKLGTPYASNIKPGDKEFSVTCDDGVTLLVSPDIVYMIVAIIANNYAKDLNRDHNKNIELEDVTVGDLLNLLDNGKLFHRKGINYV